MGSGTNIYGKNLINYKILMPILSKDYYDENVNKYKVKTETSLRFWENKRWMD